MVQEFREGAKRYYRDIRGLSSNAVKYLIGSFLTGITYSAFMLLLNLYLREAGYSETFIGKVLSAGAFGMTLVAVPASILISRIRLRPILVTTSLLYMTGALFVVHAETAIILMGAQFFAGMMVAISRVASGPFYMRNSTSTERSFLFSLSFGVQMAGGFVGPLVFGNLVGVFERALQVSTIEAFRVTLSIAALFALLAAIPFGLLRLPKTIPKEDRLQLNFTTLKKHGRLLFRLNFPYFIVGAGAGIIIPFLNLYFRDRFGQPTDTIGIYYGLVYLTMFIGIMVGPILVRKWGMVRAIVFTELASIPFMLILAFSMNLPLVLAAFFARGALMNLGVPIGRNFAMEMSPRSMQGFVNALMTVSWTGSRVISTRFGGEVIEHHGYTVALLIGVVLYVMSALFYYFTFRRAEKKTKEGIVIHTDYRMAG